MIELDPLSHLPLALALMGGGQSGGPRVHDLVKYMFAKSVARLGGEIVYSYRPCQPAAAEGFGHLLREILWGWPVRVKKGRSSTVLASAGFGVS